MFEFPSSAMAEVFSNDRRDADEEDLNSSSSSSSIGKNSDLSSEKSGDGDNENEVQSSYNGLVESLEQVLPIRRGISRFYDGKSKSFASLSNACSVTLMKHISKPENAYTRKRRNILAFNHVWDNKNRNFPSRSNSEGGISKRPASNLRRSTLALGVAMSSSESITTSDDSESIRSSMSNQDFTPWRSFSVADLQNCTADPDTQMVKQTHKKNIIKSL